MNDKYKSSIAKALNNYFEMLSNAQKQERKKQAIIKNIKRGNKNDPKRH